MLPVALLVRHRLLGVGEQVDEHLLQLERIGLHQRQVGASDTDSLTCCMRSA